MNEQQINNVNLKQSNDNELLKDRGKKRNMLTMSNGEHWHDSLYGVNTFWFVVQSTIWKNG